MSSSSTNKIPPITIKNNKIVSGSKDENKLRSPKSPPNQNHNIKKNKLTTQSKIFTSPNRFSVLQDTNTFNFDIDNDTDKIPMDTHISTETTAVDTTNAPSKKDQVPPIFIANKGLDYKLLIKSLIALIGENSFYCKSTQKNIKVQANTSDGYRQIIHFLNAQKNAQFHTYQPQNEKPFRVVIRNLHSSTSCEEIKSSLENLNLSVLQVVNIQQRQTKLALPLFFVDLAKDDNCKKIFDLTSILHTKIKVEEPHKRRELVQCQNCQDYGHTRAYCNYSPRCVRCGKNHVSSSCDKPTDVPPTCALCQGSHPANYRGCQVHKQLQKTRNPASKLPPQNVIPSPHQANPLTPPLLTSSTYVQPQISYANIASETKPKSTPTSAQPSDFTTSLNNFISEFKSIINPLLSLLTTVISQLLKNNNDK